jgi:nucleoside-diphosphate-sugar epimerase
MGLRSGGALRSSYPLQLITFLATRIFLQASRATKKVTPLVTGGPYEASKAAMEYAVRSFDKRYLEWKAGGQPTMVITCCANCYGPGDMTYRRVIPRFLKSALNKGRIDLICRKNGRQFIHICDAVAGYILAASQARQIARDHPPVFHFAIDEYTVDGSRQRWISMKQLAVEVKSAVGKHVLIDDRYADDWAPNENRIQALNCDRTKKELGWKPKWELCRGIEELKQWYSAEDDATRRKQLDDGVHEVLNLVAST